MKSIEIRYQSKSPLFIRGGRFHVISGEDSSFIEEIAPGLDRYAPICDRSSLVEFGKDVFVLKPGQVFRYELPIDTELAKRVHDVEADLHLVYGAHNSMSKEMFYVLRRLAQEGSTGIIVVPFPEHYMSPKSVAWFTALLMDIHKSTNKKEKGSSTVVLLTRSHDCVSMAYHRAKKIKVKTDFWYGTYDGSFHKYKGIEEIFKEFNKALDVIEELGSFDDNQED